MLDTQTKREVEEIAMLAAKSLFVKRVGDTPTDALQLTPKKYVDERVAGGVVASDGSKGTPFPTGWSSSRSSVGTYVITHNYGTTSYSVTGNSASTTTASIQVIAKSENSFTVTAREPLGDTLVDTDVSFCVVKSI